MIQFDDVAFNNRERLELLVQLAHLDLKATEESLDPMVQSDLSAPL